MSADPTTPAAEPTGSDVSTAWVAYILQATGAFGFVIGPLVGLVISYVRRDAPGYIASHHRWLIRTVWWTALGYLLCLAAILASVWPIASEIVREAIRTGGQVGTFGLSITWDSIFAMLGAAAAGGIGIVAVWVWNVYRILRGGFLLAERSPAP